MPTRIPWAPREPAYDHRSDIPRLLMEGGRIQAEGHLRSGSIWGQTAQQLGALAGDAFARHSEQKRAQEAEKQRALKDAAFVKAVETWDGKDPKALLTGMTRLLGREEGPQAAKAVLAFATPPTDPKQELQNLGTVLGFAEKQSDEVLARWYPSLRQRYSSTLQQLGMPPDALPPEWSPELREPLSGLAKSLRGDKGPGTREVKTRNADGSESIKIVPDTPGQEFTSAAPVKPAEKESRSLEVQMADAALKGDQETYEKLLRVKRQAAQADDKPTRAPLERVETVDAQGKPVTRFVTPSAGAEYAKPTGAGKPATGQQRKALTFFNRAKEAQEITSALEEGEKISPSSIKYVPEFANVLLSDSNQAYLQAQRTFTEARLRKESGAAVPEQEYKNDAKTYFAQPGDSTETLAQKRASRNAVLAGIAFEAADALKEFYGDEAEGMVEGLKSAQKASAPKLPAPKVGERRRIGGQLGAWDGKGWVAIKERK